MWHDSVYSPAPAVLLSFIKETIDCIFIAIWTSWLQFILYETMLIKVTYFWMTDRKARRQEYFEWHHIIVISFDTM